MTGATGFVGRSVMRRLLNEVDAHRVQVLVHDREPSGTRSRRPELIREWCELGVSVVAGELVSGRGLDGLVSDPVAVIHLAADSDTGEKDHRVNDVGSANLVSRLGGISATCRFVFTSSIAVTEHRRRRDGPSSVATRFLQARSDYGRRKLVAEHIITTFAAERGCSLLITRLSVIFGDGCRAGGFADLVGQHAGGALKGPVRAGLALFGGRVSFAHVDAIADLLVDAALGSVGPVAGEVELMYPSTETHVVHELFARDEVTAAADLTTVGRGAARRVGLALVRGAVAAMGGLITLERVMPRRLYNALWQVQMLGTPAFETVLDRWVIDRYVTADRTIAGWRSQRRASR